jgi:hypothetical protein
MNRQKIWDMVNELDDPGLDDLINMVKKRRAMLSRIATISLNVGQRVSFKGKYGRLTTGTIMGINQRSVSVNADDGRKWRVDSSLVTVL